MKKLIALVLAMVMVLSLAACGKKEETTSENQTPAQTEETGKEATGEPADTNAEQTVVNGEADGFGGVITATVTLEGDKIVDLVLVGESETPEIGGAALPQLQEAIIAAGTIDGVDGVSGATWTSNGVFAAIKNALGIEEAPAESAGAAEVKASGLKQGLGIHTEGRLGPGSDNTETPVYSFNNVIAYVITDSEDRIVDLQVDILEVITPNHDSAEDNMISGWPGSSYNWDKDGDGTVDGLYEETDETWAADLPNFLTKRQKGDAYKMNSGTWTQEMDAYESVFVGKTIDEVKAWVAAYTSDVNGRALHGTSDKPEDVEKYGALTDDEKAMLDGISTATMSLTDSHGNIIKAIEKAVANAEPINAETGTITKVGLGVTTTGRVGPGADDQGVGVYCLNTQAAGAAYDADGKVVAIITDLLEIISPNHDGAHDNQFTGWPGQSYNADTNADGTVDTVFEQTPESFLEQLSTYKTKRELDTNYKLNSGTWKGEELIFENAFTGMTNDEIQNFFTTSFSDLNGRPLNGTSDKDEDVTKRAALNDDQLAKIDSLSGATMSIKDGHGDMIGAINNAWVNAVEANIVIE